ncbi:GST-containing FLYWCH zinc-finger protein [Bombus fervidus]|uniref:GST-containing FLYWCH zinc-finger protein n=1 Tax=Bombus fervidus TaxID=203811 RepID=UPI003AB8343F
MRLYGFSDGPPSLACRQALKALNIQYELVNLNFSKEEHMTDEFAQLNPQKEVPVLVDDDVVMGESVAILQYLADKYDTTGNLYPKDIKSRAIVNHRLCFNLAMYYDRIFDHVMAPIYFDYRRTSRSVRKVRMALDCFNTYLQRLNTEYVAGNTLTIADFPLVTATMCLEAIRFRLNPWPYVSIWYNNFKQKHPELWKIAAEGMREISFYQENPPDYSHIRHPFHPTIRNFNIVIT